MEPITLRDANWGDHAAISRLHAESWRQNYRGIYSNRYLDEEVFQDRYESWRTKLQDPSGNQRTTVAIGDTLILGFSCLLLDDDPVFGTLLDNLHVAQEAQGSGIGKRLLKECAGRICQEGERHKMYLWVYERNENARRVYEHLGGRNEETIEVENVDLTTARICRYCWEDVAVLAGPH
jgi:ribosomal protein S18 acetylase RimI-like enzyme